MTRREMLKAALCGLVAAKTGLTTDAVAARLNLEPETAPAPISGLPAGFTVMIGIKHGDKPLEASKWRISFDGSSELIRDDITDEELAMIADRLATNITATVA